MLLVFIAFFSSHLVGSATGRALIEGAGLQDVALAQPDPLPNLRHRGLIIIFNLFSVIISCRLVFGVKCHVMHGSG